jgi:hypothetical protein
MTAPPYIDNLLILEHLTDKSNLLRDPVFNKSRSIRNRFFIAIRKEILLNYKIELGKPEKIGGVINEKEKIDRIICQSLGDDSSRRGQSGQGF